MSGVRGEEEGDSMPNALPDGLSAAARWTS
jgi:hypothetical protein